MLNLTILPSGTFKGNGVQEFLNQPTAFYWVWEDSFEYETEEFDEENQCMVVRTQHTYRILGIEEMCTLTFDCEEILSKTEIIERMDQKLRWGLYNEHELGEDDY